MERHIRRLGELKTWLLIEQTGRLRGKLRQRIKAGERGLTREHYICRRWQLIAVEQLPKFGVERPFREGTRKPSEESWKWYRWWKEYMYRMRNEQAEEIKTRIYEQQDVSEFRPEGTWK